MYWEAEQFEIPPPRPIKKRTDLCPICGRPRSAPYHCDDCRVACIHCAKCGHGKLIAWGLNAINMPIKRRLEIIRHLGWSYESGRILCRECSCPMSYEEKKEWQNLQDNKLDAAEYMRSAFKAEMSIKYGMEQMERYFNSLDNK